MENVWKKFLNLIFHTDVTIECKVDVHQSCRAQCDLSYHDNKYLNPFGEFQ